MANASSGVQSSGTGRAPLRALTVAALWGLVVILVVGATFTLQSGAQRLTDRDLAETLDSLLTGTNVTDGRIVAPPLTDPRALRAASGYYWQIAASEGRTWTPLERSRSLWDSSLQPPPAGPAAVASAEGQTVYYNTTGPGGQALRAAAMPATLTGYPRRVYFLAAQQPEPVAIDWTTLALTAAAGIATGLAGSVTIAAIRNRRPAVTEGGAS